jgi:hypothetical protein
MKLILRKSQKVWAYALMYTKKKIIKSHTSNYHILLLLISVNFVFFCLHYEMKGVLDKNIWQSTSKKKLYRRIRTTNTQKINKIHNQREKQ